MTKFKAVLFDLDGTLLDTLQDLADSTNRALDCLGFPPHGIVAYRHFVGDGRDVLAFRALPEDRRDSATVRKLVAEIDEDYTKHWADSTGPYPGIPELLDALMDRGVSVAVLSNKSHNFTELMVLRMLARWHFDAVIGATVNAPKKPDPALAVKIAHQLKIQPSGFIYLGDSDVDMKTAIAAGMYPVGARWGFRSAGELLASGAKMVIDQPCDLLRLL